MSGESVYDDLYTAFDRHRDVGVRSDVVASLLLGGLLIIFLLRRQTARADEAVRKCTVLTTGADYDVRSTTNSALADLMNSPAYKQMREQKEKVINGTYDATRRALAYASMTMCLVGAFLFMQKIVTYEAKDEHTTNATLPCVVAGVVTHVIPMLGGEFFVSSYIAFTAAACLLANYHVVDGPHATVASGVWAVTAGFVLSVILTFLEYRAAGKKREAISVLYTVPGC